MPALHPPAAAALLLTAAMGLLGTTAFAQEPAPVSGVDASVHPGDDFFAYANGQWLKATEIPAGRARWTVRDEIQALTRQQVASLLGDLTAGPTASPAARKIADYRAAFLDQSAIEARGLTPIQPLLKRIAVLRDKSDLARCLGSEMPADVDPMGFGGAQSAHLFGLAVDKGVGGERLNAAFLVQGGLGLPDREHYVSDAAPMQALRGKYRDYLAQLWVLSGGQPSPQRIDAVMALETAIARSHATKEESGNEENAGNLLRRADFARQAPGMDWGAFFAAAGLARQNALIVWQPNAVKSTAALLAAQPLQVWKDYLHLRTVDRYAQVLPRAIADAANALHLALHGVAVAGQSLPASRAQQVDAALQRALGESVTRLYVERHFTAAHKARVNSIAAQVKAALRERVANVTWLSPTGRQQAIAKLDAIYFGLGYPDRRLDDADLQIGGNDAFGNQRRIAQWRTRQALAQLNQPVDPQRWILPAHDVGAGLIFTQNAYNFPAGLLQPPKFDIAQSAEPDAFNFGAIGAIVGHELTHFIDTLGAEYDVQGAKRRWWSAEDMARYQAATQPLVDQFSSYRPFSDTFPTVAVDGKASLTENLADLMGLSAAFEAYRRTLATHPRKDDAEFVKQQDRLFFIGFARSWRAKLSDDALRKQAVTTHPPGRYRIATVRNFDAWYHAFDVRPGHQLWLEPKDRVQLWSAP